MRKESKKELEKRLEKLKQKEQDIKDGKYDQECEVYSRIVGYLREIKAWNAGRAQEFHDRVNYQVENNQKKNKRQLNNSWRPNA